jgi:hypothetical protein
MDQTNLGRDICGNKAEGRRNVRRPRLKWLGHVEIDYES